MQLCHKHAHVRSITECNRVTTACSCHFGRQKTECETFISQVHLLRFRSKSSRFTKLAQPNRPLAADIITNKNTKICEWKQKAAAMLVYQEMVASIWLCLQMQKDILVCDQSNEMVLLKVNSYINTYLSAWFQSLQHVNTCIMVITRGTWQQQLRH